MRKKFGEYIITEGRKDKKGQYLQLSKNGDEHFNVVFYLESGEELTKELLLAKCTKGIGQWNAMIEGCKKNIQLHEEVMRDLA